MLFLRVGFCRASFFGGFSDCFGPEFEVQVGSPVDVTGSFETSSGVVVIGGSLIFAGVDAISFS